MSDKPKDPDNYVGSPEVEEAKRAAAYNFKKRDRERREDEAFKKAVENNAPLPGEGQTFDPGTESKKGKK